MEMLIVCSSAGTGAEAGAAAICSTIETRQSLASYTHTSQNKTAQNMRDTIKTK